MRARFDIIGFDPRGVARSRPLHCFASPAEAERYFDSAQVFPYTESQEAPFIGSAARLGRLCLERGGAIIRHMSTANVARDMDFLRQAVGATSSRTTGFRTAPSSATSTRPSSRIESEHW